MAFMDWEPRFDTGIASVDFEHHKLVDLLNEVDSQVGEGADAKEVTGTLGEFHALATAHFALEEKVLRDIMHPEAARRRDEHYRLLENVRDIMDAYESGEYQEPTALPQALKDWISGLMQMDAVVFNGLDDSALERWGLTRIRKSVGLY